MKPAIQLSPQQRFAVEFILNETGNGLVESVAGSGKTFTIQEQVKVLEPEVQAAICAFNSSIAGEVDGKVTKLRENGEVAAIVNIGTVHKFGYRSLRGYNPLLNKRGVKPSNSKIDWMMDNFRNPQTHQVGVPFELRKFVKKAYNLARQCGAGILPEFPFARQDKWYEMVDHFDLMDAFADSDGNLPMDADTLMQTGCRYVVWLIKWGVELACTTDKVDFEDMLYVPLRMNLRVQTYKIIFVDECQDLNVTRRLLVKRMMAPGSRVIFVGDPHQAIYGFTGADAESFNNIRKEFATKDIPLTWSFRCSKSVVRFVQQWVSHIQSHPDAPEGSVTSIRSEEIWSKDLTADDAILCRNNAPLVDLFFDCLKHDIPAHIEGRDISDELIAMIDRWPSVKRLPALRDKMEAYKEKQIAKAAVTGKEMKAEKIADTVDAIVSVMNNLPAGSTVQTLKDKIKDMFLDHKGEEKPTLTLSTIHKSKGREWTRVFWWGRNRWNPSPFARQDWQMEQEKNLCYVAGTRAKLDLVDVYVTPPPANRFRR